MKAIIPCCGYGTRVGMRSNESKEMLPDNVNGYKHIIDYAIEQCKRFDIEPFIITRLEKQDLIGYCVINRIKYMIHEPKEGEEWNHTVLASKDSWEFDNLLILPDTRFYSPYCIEDIQRGLKLGNNAVMALHEVIDPSKWGVLFNYWLFEKPKLYENIPQENKCWAWGLIGFKNTYGQELFSDIQSPKELRNVGFTYLKSFIDITRGNS